MKATYYISILAIASVCWIATGCGHDHAHDGDHTEHSHDGHDHSEHVHEYDTIVTSNANSKVAHGDGKQYTSMYVCPMHCKGSGANEPGKCPVCEMDYVRLRYHVQDGHHHRDN